MNFYSYMNGMNAIAQDETLEEHDEKYHPKGFKDGDKCNLRDNLKKEDDIKESSDLIKLASGRTVDKELSIILTDSKGKVRDRVWSPFLEQQRDGNGAVSDEMEDIVIRLFKGEDVPDEEIERTQEWQEAMKRSGGIADKLKSSYGVSTTDEIRTPERDFLRKSIIESASKGKIEQFTDIDGLDGVKLETNEGLDSGESYEVERGHKAYIVIGFPAAGKSTTYANPCAIQNKARLCDSDTIKKVLPEFSNGYGGNEVHEESTIINQEVLRQSMDRGDNIVYPILGFKGDVLKDTIKKFHDKGYKVELFFRDVPVNIAKGRLLVRFLQKGRYLPLRCISKAAGKLEDSFNMAKMYADSYKRHGNAQSNGVGDKVIEEKGQI